MCLQRASGKHRELIMHRIRHLALLFLSVLLLSGAVRGEDNASSLQREVRIRMLWLPQAEFAGFYMAQELGFFEKEGLRVRIDHPKSVGGDSLDSLENGEADFAVTWLSPALQRTAGNGKFVNIMQIHQSCALVLIGWKADGILKPSDLSGKRIGLWFPPFLRNPFLCYFRKEQIHDVELQRVLTPVDLLLFRCTKAIGGVEYDECCKLYLSGVDRDELSIFRLSDAMPDLVDEGLYCLEKTWKESPELCRKVRRAVMAGWRAAFADKDRALRIVKQRCDDSGVFFQKYYQKKMLDVMERLFRAETNDGQLRRASFDQGVEVSGIPPGSVRYETFAPEVLK